MASYTNELGFKMKNITEQLNDLVQKQRKQKIRSDNKRQKLINDFIAGNWEFTKEQLAKIEEIQEVLKKRINA